MQQLQTFTPSLNTWSCSSLQVSVKKSGQVWVAASFISASNLWLIFYANVVDKLLYFIFHQRWRYTTVHQLSLFRRPLALKACRAFTPLSLTLISSSHSWVRFLMPCSVYAVKGGLVDLLKVSVPESHSPAVIASFSKAKTKHPATFSFSPRFCASCSPPQCWYSFKDVLLHHKSQSFTALTSVLLSGCRKVFRYFSWFALGGNQRSTLAAVEHWVISCAFTASERLLVAHHEQSLAPWAGWEEPLSALW